MRFSRPCCLLLAAAIIACGGAPPQGELTATARFDLQQAPADAVCVQITVTGATRTVTRSFGLATGQSTASLTASGLPIGAVVVTGNAYGVLCGSVIGTTTVNWVVTPVSTAFTVAGPNAIALTLVRNGQATVSIDFQDDQRTVSTLAGTALAGGTADGTGAAARFNSPSGIAVDNAGNAYLADANSNTIRKIVIATAAVTTFAGSSGAPAAEVDGTGSAARFNFPFGVAVDAAGSNLYVSDSNGCTVRKIVLATAAVSTIAGQPCTTTSADGTGAAARFLNPQGLALDGAGNLYVADQLTIRQVVLATGAVTTVAGSSLSSGYSDGPAASARFAAARGIAFDGAALWIAEGNPNHVIRKLVLLPSPLVSTFAGSGVPAETDGVGTGAAFAGPSFLAADGRGNLIVPDGASTTIRKVVEASGVVVTIAGAPGLIGSTDGVGSAARFNGPIAAAVDSSGVVYVADVANQNIRKL